MQVHQRFAAGDGVVGAKALQGFGHAAGRYGGGVGIALGGVAEGQAQQKGELLQLASVVGEAARFAQAVGGGEGSAATQLADNAALVVLRGGIAPFGEARTAPLGPAAVQRRKLGDAERGQVAVSAGEYGVFRRQTRVSDTPTAP